MKHQIRPLDVQLINQIAAGEVIEGPFSAVKELVENAIDARATDIRVEIRQGGKELIAVTDNGMGIPGDQIETAFMPHTTSKLSTIDDLQHIHTLGFRGEALASIAAVARIEVQTRAEDSLTGYRAVFESGALQALEEAGCPVGTRITVRDLFHQTPARLKFMKSDGAEASRITELITRLILSRPDIAFQYINNNNIMLTNRRQTDPLQTAMTVFPHELAKGLFIASEKTYSKGEHHLRISALIGQPQANRGNRNYQAFFVNGRSVRSDVLTHAFEQAYEGSIMIRRFPVGILYLEISPEVLDVNVHPSKTAIKFQEPQWVDDSLKDYVKQALREQTLMVTPGGLGIGPTPRELALQAEHRQQHDQETLPQEAATLPPEGSQVSLDDTAPAQPMENAIHQKENVLAGQRYADDNRKDDAPHELIREKRPFPYVQDDHDDPASGAAVPEESGQSAEQTSDQANEFFFRESQTETLQEPLQELAPEHLSQQLFLEQVLKQRQYRLVGQAFQTYLLLESGKHLYLIDQHAAHERVVYDRLLADAQRGTVDVQEVLDGQILELTLAEMEWFQVHQQIFHRMGFMVEPFGHQAIRLTGVPYHLGMPAHHQFLTNLMDELIDQEWSGGELPLEKLIRKACRYAVKAHDSLTREEITSLLDQMTSLRVPLTCPHGRPIVLQLRDYDLEKLFKRV
ncbi:MAG: DNA mismatch repair endonuclease MutL [Bacillota bacterium]|nr:DNA mismatch repair endonuclease MutL [Bacillota bacterium]MDW7678617.1 DNA mismatch repair endonuclease MutL [Bacillota bacterium]